MAKRGEIITVYLAGLAQGVALVSFPAASAVFTDSRQYGLSASEYGGMFLPQAITAIVSSLVGAGLRSRVGTKRIYILGLFANLLAMALLIASRFVMKEHSAAYGILLAATACMGTGFGFTVPALNTLAAGFFPAKADRALLALNALLGLGTALAPALAALFAGLGIWWGLPVLAGTFILALLFFSLGETLKEGTNAKAGDAAKVKGKFPARFWVFAAFALVYGVCETMNGNWASIFMTGRFGAASSAGALALGMFWGTATVGRVLFGTIEKWLPEKLVFRLLPFVVIAAFVASACAPKTHPSLGILSFALAGLGCSALLPLTLSFGQKELTAITASVAGGLIAFYQVGYGLAAFGVGPLQTMAGLGLPVVFGGAALVALAMSALAFAVTRKPA